LLLLYNLIFIVGFPSVHLSGLLREEHVLEKYERSCLKKHTCIVSMRMFRDGIVHRL